MLVTILAVLGYWAIAALIIGCLIGPKLNQMSKDYPDV